MRPFIIAVLVTATLSAPAFASGFSFELPSLTWPEPAPTEPVTKGCVAPADLEPCA